MAVKQVQVKTVIFQVEYLLEPATIRWFARSMSGREVYPQGWVLSRSNELTPRRLMDLIDEQFDRDNIPMPPFVQYKLVGQGNKDVTYHLAL